MSSHPVYTKSFGEILRQLREGNDLLLRQVAAELDIDTALLSKIERGERPLKREQVIRVAHILKVPEEDLLIPWLSDKVNDLIKDELVAKEVLKLSLKKLDQK